MPEPLLNAQQLALLLNVRPSTVRIRRESSGATVKKLAREILAKRRTEVAENRHLDKRKVPRITFFELCRRYWETVGRLKRMKGLEGMIGIWKAALGDVQVRELTPERIEPFLNRRIERDGISAATRNRHLTMLRAVFNKGIEWGLVVDNPTLGIKPLREQGARLRYLDHGEIERLLAAATPNFRPILLTDLHTGMRRGEILDLQWRVVDLSNRVLTVQTSKSGRQRTIPIDDTLHLLPSRFQQSYVFPSPRTGNRWTDFKKQFRSTVQRAGIEDFRFHDTRHTFASHLVMAGVDIKTVQELLGHASVTMTMRYSHLAPDHRLRAIKTLDSAYGTDTKTDTVDKAGDSQSA